MEKGNIKIVEIADFKNSEHVLDYVDNDFVIINSLEGSPYNEDTIRLGCFLIAICLEYRYAYPQQSHKVCRGGRGQGNLQILPGIAYGKDKRRASSLSQGSDAILVFCHFL